MLAATVPLLGLAWWQSRDRLSPEEQRLVGTWRYRDPNTGEWSVMTLAPDRRYVCVRRNRTGTPEPPPGRWSVRDGKLVVDLEADALRRSLRSVAGPLGLSVADVGVFPLASVSAGEMVIAHPRGPRHTWTRAPAD